MLSNKVPFYAINHAADVKVNDASAIGLVNVVEEHFRSRGVSFVCFRVSPLTRPESFVSLLEKESFESKGEQSLWCLKEMK